MSLPFNQDDEWLETDGWGGFATGTVNGIRTRRYHGLLTCATVPPSGRMMLLNGLEVWLETPKGSIPLSSQRYSPDIINPDSRSLIESFQWDPWPRWTFHLPGGQVVTQEFLMPRGYPAIFAVWQIPQGDFKLHVRPLLSGRDYHALHHENPDFKFEADLSKGKVTWKPYDNIPPLSAYGNGTYVSDPLWFRKFYYEQELQRGLDYEEDLGSPGVFRFENLEGKAVILFQAETLEANLDPKGMAPQKFWEKMEAEERKRLAQFNDQLEKAGENFKVRRGTGRTLIAGYPWFTDWGRDTFVALRGLYLATGKLEEAGQILGEWARTLSQGMIPNRFPDQGEWPEYNSVDASLWFGIVVFEYFKKSEAAGMPVPSALRDVLMQAVESILTGYAMGTRYDIKMTQDGLLQAGTPGVQLTWMDAKVNDWVVTPRIGKPVEVQVLWLNLLRMAGDKFLSWREIFERGKKSFADLFWNEELQCLYDVVDVDHVPGKKDATIRPNQIFAVGGLPYPLIEGDRARKVVEKVENHLWTPLGLRTLSFGDPRYHPHYIGGVTERDVAYHQGTAWPWLMGAFVEAWVNVRDKKRETIEEAEQKFIAPLEKHLSEAGLGHLSEISDGDSPYTPRGCPFQAWSLGELIRLKREVLSK
jgi:predicted glycogen debranching enzyme